MITVQQNVSYEYLNVLKLDQLASGYVGSFSKIVMYAALQHFSQPNLEPILRHIVKISTQQRVILLGGITDKARQWLFYNTPKKKIMRLVYQITNQDRIGTWWSQADIQRVCDRLQLTCQFDPVSKGRPGGHYRFDAKIS